MSHHKGHGGTEGAEEGRNETMPSIVNLIVVYVDELESVGEFFTALGLDFVQHQHGKSPAHLACERDGIVFELYPSSTTNPRSHVRLGLAVGDIYATISSAKAIGATVLSGPKSSPWGLRAVLCSPTGLKVELIENTD